MATTLAGNGSMSHEAFRGLVCGIVFGISSPLAGHPFDTLKTKMQAAPDFRSGSSLKVFQRVVSAEGVRGLYRGLLPPLLGSALFRSVQFATYGAIYAALADNPGACQFVPYTGGLQYRVVVAGVVASTVRTLIECPLEYLKVRRQVGYSWLPAGIPSVSTLYTGLGITWARTLISLGGFFVLVDSVDRHAQWLGDIPGAGPFLKGSICATLAWWAAWPLETLKSQVQAQESGSGHGKVTAVQRASALWAEKGAVGMYRGIGPGTARSFIANGAALLAFTACQDSLRNSAPQ